MRVVQVSYHVDPLGRDPDALLDAWPTLPAVAGALAAAGTDVTVVQAAHTDVERTRDGVRYRFVAERRPTRAHRRLGLWASPGGRRVERVVAGLQADVVHVHGLCFPRQTARLVRAGRPVLVQDHGDRPPGRWVAGLWRHALDGAGAVAFTAREQAGPFVAARALNGNTPIVQVLESSSTFTPGDRVAARTRTGLGGDPCCVWLGRLDDNKDPLTALRAFETVVASRPDARLWMFWRSGPLEEAVRRRVAGSPLLRERVRLHGAIDTGAVQDVLRAADLLVQASHREGSGYALLEALACGTIPIVTDIPSFRRIAGDIGALVPPDDAPALADAIMSTDWTAGSRRAARARFDTHLDFRAVARELNEAYGVTAR